MSQYVNYTSIKKKSKDLLENTIWSVLFIFTSFYRQPWKTPWIVDSNSYFLLKSYMN